MTSITPPLNVPTRPGLSRDPRSAGPSSKDSDSAFQALVAASDDGAADPQPSGSTRTDAVALRAAIAHVFNAYGFFSADECQPWEAGEPSSSGETGKVATQAGAPALADPSDNSTNPAPHPLGPGFALPQQPSSRAVPVHEGDVPVRPTHEAPASDSRLGDQFLRSLENRLENEPQRADPASEKASARRSAQAEQRDRLTLKIAEHGIELVGRLSNLSEEEKQRLIDEINSLLAAHGLPLASATLNGEAISQAVERDA